MLKECVPVTWETSTVKYSISLYTPLIARERYSVTIWGVVSPFFMVLVLCPPAWRINTYTQAIAHILRFWSLNTCVYACPPYLLSNCHAVFGHAGSVRDVIKEFPRTPPPAGASLYISGVLRVGDPVLYVIYCHFCTKYELICSFNTFCTCIRPYYVQKTYKTTYEFHFQLAFSRRVRFVTSHGVSPHLAGRGSVHYTFRAFSESETPFCT